MKTIDYFLFIKISEDEFIDSFQKKGHIYCNTIKYFRLIEDNKIRGDKNEGKAFLRQVENIEIFTNNKPVAKGERAQIFFDHPNDIGNIFCMYGVQTSLLDLTTKSRRKIKIESNTKELGNFALLIYDPGEFLNRISKELKSKKIDFDFSPVNYYDPNTFEGELSPFYKSNIYKYQNEVRLWIPNKKEELYEFFIGDISDISYKIPVSDLNNIEVDIK